MKIGYVTLDWSNIKTPEGNPSLGGAGWYRVGMPAEALQKYGNHDVVVGQGLARRPSGEMCIVTWDGEIHDNCDVIVLQRWMSNVARPVGELAKFTPPLQGNAARSVREARACGQIVLNDLDDWYEGLDPTNQAYMATHPKVNPYQNRKIYAEIIAASSGLTVSTPFLKERYQRKHPGMPIHVVRNAIDLDRWLPLTVDSDPLTVGWVGHTGFRSRDLETIAPIMRQFYCKHPEALFQHSGTTPTALTAGQVMGFGDDVQQVLVEQSPIHLYPNLFFGLKVGLVPLSDSTFNLAKSAIKGMEYAASGLPFIAADTPEYVWLRSEHGVGITARKPRDWERYLEQLVDPQERAAMGAKNRRHVAALDISGTWKAWEAVYRTFLT